MKVLHIYPFYHKSGGVERYLWELSNNQARNSDYELSILCSNTPTAPPARITFHKIGLLNKTLTKYLFPYLSSLLIFSKKLLNSNTIIHAQGASSFFQDVVTAQSCHKAWFLFSLKQLSPLKVRFWLKLLNPIHHATILIETLQYRPFTTRRIVAVSEIAKREIVSNFSFPSEKIDVIHSAVNTEEFNISSAERKSEIRKSLNLNSEDLIICFAGNEFARKGLATLISALGDLKFEMPWTLCVCGNDNPRQYLSHANSLGIAPNIRFVGKVENLADWFAVTDIFALPTSTDAFGLVVLEAMASGLPVITTRAAGVSEVISTGENGLLIDDARSVADLKSHLATLMKSPNLRQTMGKAARRTAEKMTWESVAAKYHAIYSQIIQEKSFR